MIREYVIEKKLGVGTYGVVYLVSKKIKISPTKNKEYYVIKQISLFGLNSSEIKEVKSEASILSQIKSIYIVKYLDSFEENNNLNIVMEYCDGGDLEQLISNKKKFPLEEELIWKLFIQITLGLTALHNLKILHRDLKSSNIFLTKDLKVKIGDLGVAKKLSRGNFAKTIIGTPYYLSPEICEEKPYNEKSDIWALGCILYELCTFNHPFDAKSQGALVLKILNSNPAPIRKTYSDNLQKLLDIILEKNLNKRPSCKTILRLPYIIEKVKKFGMIDQYKNIGLKIPNKNSKKMIKGEKIDLNIKNVHINISAKKNLKKYHTDYSNISTSSSHYTKKDNPWADHRKNFKKNKSKIEMDVKMTKKNTNENLKLIKIESRNKKIKNFLSNKAIKSNQKIISLSKERKVTKRDLTPVNKKKNIYKLNKKYYPKKVISQNLKNANNEKQPNKVVKIDLTNTLELNNIINSYLDKEQISRESKALQNIKEFANNLNNYFTNNVNIVSTEKEKSPFKLTNKDNNTEHNNTLNNTNNKENIIDHSNVLYNPSSTENNSKQGHDNILKFDIERLPTIKMGINSYDELLDDFTASRGNTLVNNLNNNKNQNNNLSNINKSPFEKETKDKTNNSTIIIRDSLFQVFDNKNNKVYIFNKDNNSCQSDEEVKNKNHLLKNIEEEGASDNDDSGEENVKTIHCDNNKIGENNKDEKQNILEDKKLLTDRLNSIKKEMLELLGEDDYKYVMEMYSIIDKSKIDEIYYKIEEYVQKYDEDKKDKFDMLYFKLISTDCQIQQKNSDLRNLFFNDF